MATYVNNLRLKEIATGDESGTWGTSTNTNLELITDGFSYGTKEMAADANETFTMPDGTADDTRSFYLKFTSAVDLTATREITLGPNTVSKTWIIENATTGGQIITIKQGSGATVNIANGSKVMVVTDGAGAGAAVFNANPTEVGGTVTSVGGTGTVQGLTLSGTVTSSGNLTLGGSLADVDLTSQVTGTLPVANGGTGSTTASGALTNFGITATATELNYTDGVTSNIQAQLDTKVGTVTSVGGTGTVDGLTLSGTVTSSGDLTLSGSVSIDNTNWSGTDLSLANGGTGASLVDPNADRIFFWDDSAGATTFLTVGSGLQISGTTLENTQSGGSVTSVAGTGNVNGLTLSGTVITAGSLTLGGTLTINNSDWSGADLSLANGGTGASLSDPNADRIFFWDDSAGATTFLTVGSGLQISGTTLSSIDAGGTVTSVAVSGGTTGLTTSGGPVTTSGTITLAGTLAVANGGTGSTTASGALTNLGLTATATELNYTDGVTSNIQTQLNAKASLASPTFTGTVTADGLSLGDGDKAQFGAGNDLEIYHNGLNSYINDTGTGSLYIRAETELVLSNAFSSQTYFRAQNSGPTTMYYSGYAKLATTNTGIDVTGTVAATNVQETVYALTGTALDAGNGGIQTKTLAANTTFTDSLSSGESIVLQLEAGSSYTVTWPTITWVTSAGNVAPTLTANDTLVFWKVSSTLYGAYTGSYA